MWCVRFCCFFCSTTATDDVLLQSTFFLLEKHGGNASRTEGDWHVSSTTCAVVDTHNGVYITAARERSIRLWSFSNFAMVRSIQSPDWIYAMCVIGGKTLCTSAADRRVRLYDVHTWERVKEVESLYPAVCLCTWRNKDGDMLAYGDDKGRVTVANITHDVERAKADSRQTGPPGPTSWAESRVRRVHDGWVHQVSRRRRPEPCFSQHADAARIG